MRLTDRIRGWFHREDKGAAAVRGRMEHLRTYDPDGYARVVAHFAKGDGRR